MDPTSLQLNDGGIPLLIVTLNFVISAGIVWLLYKLFFRLRGGHASRAKG